MFCKRHPNLSLVSRLLLGSSILLLFACAPKQTPLPVEVNTAIVVKPKEAPPTSTTHSLEPDAAISSSENPLLSEEQDPWRLIELAQQAAPEEKNTFTLRAIELFIEQAHYSTAVTLLNETDKTQLSASQKNQFTLLQARLAIINGEPELAISLLQQIRNAGALNFRNEQRALNLEIALATKSGVAAKALSTRLKLDGMLSGALQLKNQLQILNSLTRDPGLLAEQDSVNLTLSSWRTLAQLRREGNLNETNINLWRAQNPNHPAQALALLHRIAVSAPISANQIALLLPLTSNLGRAAQAFKAGFDAALKTDGRFDNSRVYDIGSEAELSAFYYQNAINDSADFIIGPLGKKASDSLLEYLINNPQTQASTLILTRLTPQHNLIPNLWGLALSPEQDAEAIAERAINQGYRRALSLVKNNQWGARINTAFTTAFEAKGGTVLNTQRYLPGQVDNSIEVKNLLAINDSEIRHLRLQKSLGRRLKFSVQRRDDIDFIFLAANAKEARNIMPLLKFYRAHDLPVFSSASVYSGKSNKLSDEDLTGLQFADLPWLLFAQTSPPMPYQSAGLNRLYALGYAAFEAIPEIANMQADSWQKMVGKTMLLNMDENRNLDHATAWGKFTKNGVVVDSAPTQ